MERVSVKYREAAKQPDSSREINRKYFKTVMESSLSNTWNSLRHRRQEIFFSPHGFVIIKRD